MYYQSLTNMKLNSWIRKSDIKKLDEWLIRVPYRNRNNLNFLKFSIDEDIHEEIAFNLFISATKEESKVLQITYNVVTDDRMQSLGVYESRKSIPLSIFNYDSGEKVVVKDSNIEVRFKIIAFPTQTLSVNEKKSVQNEPLFSTVESVKKYLTQSEMNDIFI